LVFYIKGSLEWNEILDVHISNSCSSFKTSVGYIKQLLLYNYKTRFVSIIGKNKKEKKIDLELSTRIKK